MPIGPKNELESATDAMRLETEKNEMPDMPPEKEVPDLTNLDYNEMRHSESFEGQILKDSNKLTRSTIIHDIRAQRSLALQETSKKELSQSRNLIDESIRQLQELTKLSITSLHSQDAKNRDAQMVNAAINSAKAINELLKTKLSFAGMHKA